MDKKTLIGQQLDFLKDDPMVVATAFLQSWVDGDVLAMNGLIWKTGQQFNRGLVGVLLRMGLKEYKADIEESGPLSCSVAVKLRLAIARGVVKEVSATMKLVREAESLVPAEDGEWGVVPESLVGAK